VSFANADMLSRVRALASCFSVRLNVCGLNCRANRWSTGSSSRWEYHTSRLFIPANSRIAVRYSLTVSSTTLSCCLAEKRLSIAAINMLAASRFTSHSHGPGSVSSKSLTSNTSRRSGDANAPKFDR
jgi:hypothetical protein